MVSRIWGYFTSILFFEYVSWFYVIERRVMGWSEFVGIYNIIGGEEFMMFY